MTLYFDLSLRRFVVSPGVTDEVTSLIFKRGDTLSIDVRFILATVVTELGGSASGKFGLKESGEYSADFITADSAWTKTGTGTSTKYTFALPLNTSELNALLAGDIASVDLMAEMQVTDGSEVYSSNTLTATVQNDVIKDSETGPTVITGGTPVNQVTASSTITINNQPEANDTLIITVGATVETLTFVSGTPAANQVQIGGDIETTRDNLGDALASSSLVLIASNSTNALDLTAATDGAAGQYTVTGTAISGGDITESAAVAGVTATAGHLGTMKVDSSFLYVVASVTSSIPLWKKTALSSL